MPDLGTMTDFNLDLDCGNVPRGHRAVRVRRLMIPNELAAGDVVSCFCEHELPNAHGTHFHMNMANNKP